jgi:3-dehydroquinate dehydratase
VRAELEKKNSPIQSVIDYVKSTQPNLQGEALQEEILTQLTGKKGLELLQSKKKGGIIDWIKEALAEIANMLGLSNYSVEKAMNMTIDEFAKAIAVDLLKGEKLYQKATQAENYYQRNADRLPLTLSVFNRPEFLAMQGKMVNPITVLNSLNQTGIKQVEKDLIKGVIEENYPGQKKISYDDLEATVRANIMPLERIFTSSYSDYGMDRLGNGDYGTHNTIIFNAPIEHGFVGNHFKADFRKSGRKNIKYVPKQLNDNTWIAVEEGYQNQANPNNIYNFVGTAGTKESVDNWIKKYGEFTPLTKLPSNYTFIKDGDKIGVIEENETSARPLTGLYNTEKEAEEAALEKINFDLANRDENINKGMFGHIRVWQDGDVFYVAELQSDYFQKNNARKEILEKNKDYKNAKFEYDTELKDIQLEKDLFFTDYQNLFLTELEKMDNVEIKPHKLILYDGTVSQDEYLWLFVNGEPLYSSNYTTDSNYSKQMQRTSIIKGKSLTALVDILGKEVLDKIDDEVRQPVKQLEKDIKSAQKKFDNAVENIIKGLSPQEKQFIASQKEWEKRLVREAIKEASLSGATELRFPTPYTLSVIEAYTSEAEGAMPYDIENAEDSTYLTTGDRIYYIDSEYTVLDSDGESITIAPTKDVIRENINDLFQNEIDFRVGETMDNDLGFETKNAFYTKEEWEDIKNSNSTYYLFQDMDLEDIADEKEEGVYEINDEKVEEIVRESYQDSYNDINNLLTDIGYDNIYTSGDYVYYTPSEISTETLGQPDTYSQTSKEDFSISDLSSEQQTVARKYEEIADILKQERGEENVEIITDENGFDWYETKLAPEEVNQPVVAFQKQFEIPTEETTTIPDCV